MVEAMGGDVQDVEVSALKKTNLDELIEKIQLQAELLELKANPDRAAEGTVIEAKLDKGRGPVATCWSPRHAQGRRRLRGRRRERQGPRDGRRQGPPGEGSRPVDAGRSARPVRRADRRAIRSTVVENEARAREVAAYRSRRSKKRTTVGAGQPREHVLGALETQAIEYPLVVKADTQGSVEAIVSAINKISTDEIKARVLHSGVGGITESDVTLAGPAARRSSASTSVPMPRRAKIADRAQGRAQIL
jgi:translation initiation factor IF-2